MVSEIDARVHGEDGWRPGEKGEEGPGSGRDAEAADAEEGEVDGEEEHVLRVAGRPSMGVAHLEGGAGVGAGLLHRGLDEFVEDLGDEEA